MNIKTSLIDADPSQPRQEFNPRSLDKLCSSIENHGILTPLSLEKNYEKKNGRYLVIDGERRFRCVQRLKIKEVPAKVVEGPLTGVERMIMRFQIQETHASWSHFDRARAIYFFKESEGLTGEEIGEMLGITRATVYTWLSILELSRRSQTTLIERKISFSYLPALISIIKSYQELVEMPAVEIEKKLIDKIVSRILLGSTAMANLRAFMKLPGNEKAKVKFLNIPSMTLKELVVGTEEGKIIKLDRLVYSVNSLWRASNQAIQVGLAGYLTIDQQKAINRLIVSLNHLKSGK